MMQVEEKGGTWYAWDKDAGEAGIWALDNTREDAIARFERALLIEERMRKERPDEQAKKP